MMSSGYNQGAAATSTEHHQSTYTSTGEYPLFAVSFCALSRIINRAIAQCIVCSFLCLCFAWPSFSPSLRQPEAHTRKRAILVLPRPRLQPVATLNNLSVWLVHRQRRRLEWVPRCKLAIPSLVSQPLLMALHLASLSTATVRSHRLFGDRRSRCSRCSHLNATVNPI